MPIRSIKLTNFRNLSSLSLEFCENINFLIGSNGTGKTSILEAIFLLSTGRSFRSSNLSKLIKFEEPYLTINAVVAPARDNHLTVLIDYHRTKSAEKRLLLNNCKAKSVAQVAALLPVCKLDSETFHALSSAPLYRRQLYDWGMFHVKHEFLNTWRKFEAVLKQRNALLKQANNNSIKINELRSGSPWGSLFIESAAELVQLRQEYFNSLQSSFAYYIDKLLPKFSYQIQLELNHGVGFEQDASNIISSLNTALTNKLSLDVARGYTSIGPHRMDVVFKYNDQVAKDLVSRGQEKLIIVAFYLAQLSIIKNKADKNCTVLIDDLAAELDQQSRELLYEQLILTNHQLIFSAINEHDIGIVNRGDEDLQPKMFHVEQMNKIIKES